MKSVSVFLNIAILADFQWINADNSWTQEMCHVEIRKNPQDLKPP